MLPAANSESRQTTAIASTKVNALRFGRGKDELPKKTKMEF
jgi:hypothetical protein